MRPTRHLWVGSVLDAPSAELRKTARRVARAQTRRLRETKSTTSPYHKEQYINAFIEAHSVELVHQHIISASASTRQIEETPAAALTASHELTTLAQELDARYSARDSPTARARFDTEAASAHSPSRPRIWLPSPASRIEFGAWRSMSSGDARLRRRLRSADVMRHCVVREARTPPSLSPEVIQRMLPAQLPAPAQRLIGYLKSARFQESGGPTNCDRLQVQLEEALHALRHSHELQRAVAIYAVLFLSAFRDWHTASTILVSLVQQWPACVVAPGTSSSGMTKILYEDRSHMIALFMETARWRCSRPSVAAPSLDELERVCAALHAPFVDKAACTGAAPLPRWDSVVSAPLLSLMGMHKLPGDRRACSETAKVKSLAERFCLHRSATSSLHSSAACAAGPAYMPAVAWGEYLRALHRCGASLAEMQEATDRITDTACTRHADSLLRSTHVWNAYLSCSPGNHAKEVYEKNLCAYRVTETPATTAAVVTALLQDGTAESHAEARALWNRLPHKHPSGKVVLHTCSTLTAHIRLLEVERQADALLELLTSFEGIYQPFGVAPASFSRAVEKVRQRSSGDSASHSWGLDLLAYICNAHPFLVPPPVCHALVQAIERTTAAAASAEAAMAGQNGTGVPPLSAEDLADLL
ncbi:hypothetical protein LSCM1_01340 [Leishmania martiniquensis]|uniref:Uncharacterized protein n=1 Tax=Leishmania martiniquensis TaxID=1580590 RepID=A0A836FXR3_9TRYP|nr:hypothetical protein LSCM1_01340 [Leishmania martiniquensis]